MAAIRTFRNFLGLYSLVIGAAAIVAVATAVLVFVFLPELQVAARVLLALALILLLLFVAGAYTEVRTGVLSRQTRYGTNTGVMAVAFLGIAILINVVSAQNFHRADLTEGAQFTLSRHTQAALKGLKAPVKVTGFFTRKSAEMQASRQSAENLLSEYRYHTDKFEYQFLDPEESPGLARQYEVRDDGALVFEFEGRRRQIFGIGEQEFTGAILAVTGIEQQKIYFIGGHGEPDVGSADQRGFSFAKDGLTTDNYEVRTLNLNTVDRVPADATVVVVAAPRTPYLEPEVRLLNQYLDNGGKALFLLDPTLTPELRSALARWGVQVKNGTVVDQASHVPPDVTNVVRAAYDRTMVITKDLPATFFPGAAGLGIEIPEDDRDHVFVLPLVVTSPQSFLETTPDRIEFNEGQDQRGPFPLGVTVLAEKPIGQRPQRTGPSTALPGGVTPQITPEQLSNPTRLVVFADYDFATDQFFYSLGNSDLFLNSINWLTGSEELVSIRTKPEQFRRLVVTQRIWNFILYSSVALWPLALLVAGAIVYWRRR